MALGLRKYILRAITPVVPYVPLISSVASLVFLIALPLAFERKTYFSENGLLPSQATAVAKDHLSGAYDSLSAHETIVSRKTTSSERLIVVVNASCSESIRIASALVHAWRDASYLAIDVEVLSVASFDRPLVSRGKPVRGMMMIDVCGLNGPVCLDSVGKYGLMPNLDIANVVEFSLRVQGVPVDTECQSSTQLTQVQRWALQQLPSHKVQPFWTTLFRMLNSCRLKERHSQFRLSGVHSLTIRTMPSSPSYDHQIIPFHSIVTAIENWARSLNNLNERLHHSFFMYYRLSPSSFIDNEVAQGVAFGFILSIGVALATGYGMNVAGMVQGLGLVMTSTFCSYLFPPFTSSLLVVATRLVTGHLIAEPNRESVARMSGLVVAAGYCLLTIALPALSLVVGPVVGPLSLFLLQAVKPNNRNLIRVTLIICSTLSVLSFFLLVIHPNVECDATDPLRLFFAGGMVPLLDAIIVVV